MATKKKQRKIQQEHREFKAEWDESYAFTQNFMGLPTCLICNEKLSNKKKSNLGRHFSTKHDVFARKYSLGEERKKAVTELKQKMKQSTSRFSNWIQSSSNVTAASFASDESFVEPFGAGDSDADPDFVAEPKHSSSSSIHSDFEEVIYEIRNDTDKTKRRRSVQHPSQIEKTFSRKRKNNKDEWQKNKAKELRIKGMCYESMQVKKKMTELQNELK
jgi:hypothetical protein